MIRPDSTFRARLIHALETEPHLDAHDVATTVERLLAEQRGAGDAPTNATAACSELEPLRLPSEVMEVARTLAGDPAPDRTALREQMAEALPCPACPAAPGTPCLRARADNAAPHMARIALADILMPVVEEAMTEAVLHTTLFGWRPRAEQAEAAVHRIRTAATEAQAMARQGFTFRLGGRPFPAYLRASDVLAILDADQPKETR